MTTIAGAGAAGLSLGLMLADAHVYEQADTPGGLCRSTTVDGFTFDQGPHILGGIPEAVDWIVQSSGFQFVRGETRNRGYARGEWCAHPFDDETLGHAYMAKMWKQDPDHLSTAGLTAQQGRRPGGVRTFLYPERGGYQAITDAWAARLGHRLHLGERCRPAEGVIWTGKVPGAAYNGLTVATIGVLGPDPDLTAVYLPEGWTPFHRLSFPSAFSPHNAPKHCYSIQGECSWYGRPPRFEAAACLEDTARHLGLVTGPVVMFDVATIPDAYPVPLGLPPALSDGMTGHGRTGAHRYLNLDGVVAAGLALASVAA